MNETHKGRDNLIVTTICLELVRIYGESPRKVVNRIKSKILINIKVTPKVCGPKRFLNSECIFILILLKITR